MAEMPDERDITKQQLWERIDTAIETIATVGRNTADNVNAALPALKRENELALAEFRQTLKNNTADVIEWVGGKIKFLEKLNNDGFGKMVNEGNRIRADVDKRIQTLDEEMNKNMGTQIQEAFKLIADKITELNENVKDFKTTTDTQMKTLQQEWLTKLGEVKALFTDMQKKFKKISEQLS